MNNNEVEESDISAGYKIVAKRLMELQRHAQILGIVIKAVSLVQERGKELTLTPESIVGISIK